MSAQSVLRLAILGLFAGLPLRAVSEGPAASGSAGGSPLDAEAEFDLRGGDVSDFVVDDSGARAGGGRAAVRLRAGASYALTETLAFRGDLDLVAGNLFAAFPELPEDGWTKPFAGLPAGPVRLDPRRLYLEWRTPYGLLRAGQQESRFGMGVLANDGRQEGSWGAPRHGDLVERVLFVTRPFDALLGPTDVYAAVGADLVYRDENADLLSGDLALQAIASLLWRPKSGDRSLGVYLAYRNQRDRPDATGFASHLEAFAIDLYGEHPVRLAEGRSWVTRFEYVFLLGGTDRLRPEAAPEGVAIRAEGFAGSTALHLDDLGLELQFAGGYASGDGDPEDGILTRFRFDPDFRPSLVLFEHVMAAQSARSSSRVADPARSLVPSPGWQYLPTGGGVSGAYFAGPSVRYRPHFADGLTLKVGLLYAETTTPPADPYASFARGGAPTTLYGQPAVGSDLGLEIDLGATYRAELPYGLSAELTLEYGRLLPGSAFQTAEGRLAPVEAVFAGGRFLWRMN